jgi:hypothetical protein
VDAPKAKPIWVPIQAVTEGFQFGRATESGPEMDTTRRPVTRIECHVIDGTIQVNRNLPDSVFSVTRPGGPGQPEWLERARKRHREAEAARSRQASEQGAQDDLDARLDEAGRQVKQLEASSRARQHWSAETLTQLGLAGLGVTLLAMAVYYLRRNA